MFMANRWGNSGNSGWLYFWGAVKSLLNHSKITVNITGLWYRDGFCHTSTWNGHSYTYVPAESPSPSYPSRLSQTTGFGFPVSYSKFPLAIYFTYGHVYVSMLLSQIIPPSPSPLCPKVCSSCLHLLCFPTSSIIGTTFLDSIYMC